ncbi:hypothetical protein O3P69_015017, partial [Scylla paramamosain]
PHQEDCHLKSLKFADELQKTSASLPLTSPPPVPFPPQVCLECRPMSPSRPTPSVWSARPCHLPTSAFPHQALVPSPSVVPRVC